MSGSPRPRIDNGPAEDAADEIFMEEALRCAQRALEIYTQGVQEVARQNLEVVRQTYTLGRATLLDVIAEQRRYIDVETGYTDALKQVYDAAVDIERAVGTLEH